MRRDRLPIPIFLGFPGGSDSKESTRNAGDLDSDPWVGKIPWRRAKLPTSVFWPGEFHGLCSQWGHKELDSTGQLSLSLQHRQHVLHLRFFDCLLVLIFLFLYYFEIILSTFHCISLFSYLCVCVVPHRFKTHLTHHILIP